MLPSFTTMLTALRTATSCARRLAVSSVSHGLLQIRCWALLSKARRDQPHRLARPEALCES